MEFKYPVIFIIGPTASGKTQLALEVANILNCPIISADSKQIYKYFTIGTAKPEGRWSSINGENEFTVDGVRYYLVDFLDPLIYYSAGDYFEDVVNILKKTKSPVIISGGSSFYLDALINGVSQLKEKDINLRLYLSEISERLGREFLYNELKSIDFDYAKKTQPQNIQRIIRALENFYLTSQPFHQLQKKKISFSNCKVFGIKLGRNILKEKIKKRLEKMYNNGFIDEVKDILSRGISVSAPAFFSHGYREVVMYLTGKITLDEAKQLTLKEIYGFTKRQLTFFKKIFTHIQWFEIKTDLDFEELAKKIIYEPKL